MSHKPFVAGVGMIPFTKPGAERAYDVMGARRPRARRSPTPASTTPSVQQAYVGYVYGDSTSGQAALYGVGLTGIPVVNVNNNCSTGSTALFLARQAVESGAVDCALALGFEQMQPGALGAVQRPAAAVDAFDAVVERPQRRRPTMPLRAAHYFGGAGREYMDKYGTTPETFAKIRSRRAGMRRTIRCAVFRNDVTLRRSARRRRALRPADARCMLPADLRRGRGGDRSEDFARKHGLRSRRAIAGAGDDHRPPDTFEPRSMIKLVGYDMTRAAASRSTKQAGVGPRGPRRGGAARLLHRATS